MKAQAPMLIISQNFKILKIKNDNKIMNEN